MIDDTTIRQAAEALLRAAPAGSTVVLFGSHARGTAREQSDLDFLVIEPQVDDPLGEMVRLRRVLDGVIRPFLVPADVLVTSRERFEHWRDTPNTVHHRAATEGRAYERVSR